MLPRPAPAPPSAQGSLIPVALEPLGVQDDKGTRAQVAVRGQAEGREEGETVLKRSNAWAGCASPRADTDTRLSLQSQTGRARVGSATFAL